MSVVVQKWKVIKNEVNWTDFRTILLGELEKHFDLETTYNNGTHLLHTRHQPKLNEVIK